jgi:hypothetical protein
VVYFAVLVVVPQWCAPEVCLGLAAARAVAHGEPPIPVPAKTTGDVYMLGGLAYELLTAGMAPFHWLSRNAQILVDRRVSEGPVRQPGIPVPLPGLLHKNVMEAAGIDGEPVPWCVQGNIAPGSGGRLEELKALVASLLAAEPDCRPKLPGTLAQLKDMVGLEAAEASRADPPSGLSGSPAHNAGLDVVSMRLACTCTLLPPHTLYGTVWCSCCRLNVAGCCRHSMSYQGWCSKFESSGSGPLTALHAHCN